MIDISKLTVSHNEALHEGQTRSECDLRKIWEDVWSGAKWAGYIAIKRMKTLGEVRLGGSHIS